MKTIIIPNSIHMIKSLKEQIDGVLLGLKDFSITYEKSFTIEEIKKVVDSIPKKEIFISINKNILNHEVETLYEQLEMLNHIPITGILFYDLALIHRKEKIKHELWWAQEHFTTNYLTIQYYEKENIKGTYLSSDITKKDLEEIRQNTKMKLMVNVFGYLPIFVSRRHAIENYKKTFQIKNVGKEYTIEKEGKRYPIVDGKHGTCVYSHAILNGTFEVPSFKKEGFEYIVLNSFRIKEDIFGKIVSLFSHLTEENKEECEQKINKWCEENTDKAFLYRDTIVKVK